MQRWTDAGVETQDDVHAQNAGNIPDCNVISLDSSMTVIVVTSGDNNRNIIACPDV